jgi:cytosine/adenosine deaminase-related metal-dependent hydrolase
LYDSDAWLTAGTRQGAAECLGTGTAAVGDSTPRWRTSAVLDESGLGGVVFLEVFGFGGTGHENTLKQLEHELAALVGKHVGIGVSPHAPYTADAETYRECAAFARANGMRLMTHLAETTEELELLERGQGALAEFFNRRAGPSGAAFCAPGLSPIAYAASLDVLGPTTVIAHANYVSDDDIRMLADSGAHVAFCPGSHAFFRHPRHPVERLLSAGVNVALGTDSLASNDSLSMLVELRRVRETYPGIEPATALRMATENGARALGVEGRYGTLAPGKTASFVGIRPPRDVGLSAATAITAALAQEACPAVSVMAGAVVRGHASLA